LPKIEQIHPGGRSPVNAFIGGDVDIAVKDVDPPGSHPGKSREGEAPRQDVELRNPIVGRQIDDGVVLDEDVVDFFLAHEVGKVADLRQGDRLATGQQQVDDSVAISHDEYFAKRVVADKLDADVAQGIDLVQKAQGALFFIDLDDGVGRSVKYFVAALGHELPIGERQVRAPLPQGQRVLRCGRSAHQQAECKSEERF
jgi:hypothetical protein